MSLFFYRAWAGIRPQRELSQAEPIYYTRWGYAALLAITMVVGIVLNLVYLFGYLVCPSATTQVPHVAIVGLAIRDLLVCLVVFPAALDWLVVGLSSWSPSGGSGWCAMAVFFDFFLNTLYPLLLISLCLILYTRKVPPPPEIHSREASLHILSSRMSARSGYTHRTQATLNNSAVQPPLQQQRGVGRPPSVASNRPSVAGQGADFRKGFAKTGSRENSIAGSERGSVVGGPAGRRKRLDSVESYQQQYLAQPSNPRVRDMRSLSPLRVLEEERAPSVAGSDLWESASLDYPGLEEDDFDVIDDEPRLREWLRYLIPLSYGLALGFGIPAAMNIDTEKSPGCYVRVSPFDNPSSYVNYDPGFNMMICSVVLTYIAPALAMIMFSLLLCTTRWTKDGKLNRFYKMCIALCVFFICVKSPIDIIQFKDLIFAIQGSRIINQTPNELEQEVLLVWSALLPVVADPIIYLTCVSDYRLNIANAWKFCLGRKVKGEEYHLEEYQENKDTKESDVL